MTIARQSLPNVSQSEDANVEEIIVFSCVLYNSFSNRILVGVRDIRFKWNDAKKEFTASKREHDYKGMSAKRQFRVVLVGDGEGIGMREYDGKIMEYSGKKQTIRF